MSVYLHRAVLHDRGLAVNPPPSTGDGEGNRLIGRIVRNVTLMRLGTVRGGITGGAQASETVAVHN